MYEEQNKIPVALVVAIVALLVAGIALLAPMTQSEPEADPVVALGDTNFTAIVAEDGTFSDDVSITDDLTVGDDATIGGDATVTGAVSAEDLASTDDLTVADDVTITDDTVINGNLTVDDIVIFDSLNLTVTDGITVTPAATFYHLDSAGAVTMTLNACSVDGQLLVLFADDANNVIIADSNIRTTTGSALTLNTLDIAFFICETTEWIQLLLAADS